MFKTHTDVHPPQGPPYPGPQPVLVAHSLRIRAGRHRPAHARPPTAHPACRPCSASPHLRHAKPWLMHLDSEATVSPGSLCTSHTEGPPFTQAVSGLCMLGLDHSQSLASSPGHTYPGASKHSPPLTPSLTHTTGTPLGVQDVAQSPQTHSSLHLASASLMQHSLANPATGQPWNTATW